MELRGGVREGKRILIKRPRLFFAEMELSPGVSSERQRRQERSGQAVGRARCIPVHDKLALGKHLVKRACGDPVPFRPGSRSSD